MACCRIVRRTAALLGVALCLGNSTCHFHSDPDGDERKDDTRSERLVVLPLLVAVPVPVMVQIAILERR